MDFKFYFFFVMALSVEAPSIVYKRIDDVGSSPARNRQAFLATITLKVNDLEDCTLN